MLRQEDGEFKARQDLHSKNCLKKAMFLERKIILIMLLVKINPNQVYTFGNCG